MIDAPRPDEFPLVFDAWANSFRKSPWAGCVPNHLWDQVSRETSRTIMERGGRVIVSVTPIAGREDEFPTVRRVMGFLVAEPDRRVLHWVFVKKDYRGMGVGRELLNSMCPSGEWTYTHRTRASSKFLGERFRWDPIPARVK